MLVSTLQKTHHIFLLLFFFFVIFIVVRQTKFLHQLIDTIQFGINPGLLFSGQGLTLFKTFQQLSRLISKSNVEVRKLLGMGEIVIEAIYMLIMGNEWATNNRRRSFWNCQHREKKDKRNKNLCNLNEIRLTSICRIRTDRITGNHYHH